MSSSRLFRTCQYIVAAAIIIIVNLRYVICNLFGYPTLPHTILITLLLLVGIDYTKVVLKELLIILLFLGITAYHFNAIAILTFILFCHVCRSKFKTLLLINFITMMIMIGCCISFFVLGITQDHAAINLIKEGHTLGFSNPNIFSLYIYGFLLTLYAITPRKYIILAYAIMLYVAFAAYSYSASRTSFMGVLCVIICDLFINILPKSFVQSKCILYLIPLILSSLSVYLCINWEEYIEFDALFSGRLSIMGSVVENVSPLGYVIGFQWPDDAQRDNAYIAILSSGGLAAFWLYFSYYSRYVNTLKYVGLSTLPIIMSVLLSGLSEYVFVGLNMISITLVLVVKKLFQDVKTINHPSHI